MFVWSEPNLNISFIVCGSGVNFATVWHSIRITTVMMPWQVKKAISKVTLPLPWRQSWHDHGNVATELSLSYQFCYYSDSCQGDNGGLISHTRFPGLNDYGPVCVFRRPGATPRYLGTGAHEDHTKGLWVLQENHTTHGRSVVVLLVLLVQLGLLILGVVQ